MGTYGRNVRYSEKIADEILRRIADGEPLSRICRNEGMPHRTTVVDIWCRDIPGFAEKYKKARDDGFDAIAEGCIDIADDGTNDYMAGKDGPVLDSEHVQRSKLRVWTRLELLKRWDPKRYGDLLKQEHAGKDGTPLNVSVVRFSDEE